MKSKFKKQYLFCPGPVNVATNVKNAVFNEVGHRESDFSNLLTRLNTYLLDVLGAKARNYHSVFITGSGTAANETVYASIGSGAKVLVISNGEFGERLYDISKMHNKPKLLSFEWGETLDLSLIDRVLRTKRYDYVAVVHHETSTGMLNPIVEVGKIAKRNGARLIVDAVSSLGAEKIDLKAADISFLTSSSGKALGSLPGVGIIVGKEKEFKKLQTVKNKVVYLSLYNLYIYSKTLHQTPNTPAVHLFYSLETALLNILKEEPECRRDYIRTLAERIRDEVKGLGMEFLIAEDKMCSVLTTVKLPEYLTFEHLRNKLLDKNYVVYNGKGPLANKVFQIANIGEIKVNDIHKFVHVLREILDEFTVEDDIIKSIVIAKKPQIQKVVVPAIIH